MKFLRTLPAQKIFAENGYRPVVGRGRTWFQLPDAARSSFTIKYVGGWPKVEKKFFDPKHGHHGALPGVEWRLTPERFLLHPGPGGRLRRASRSV